MRLSSSPAVELEHSYADLGDVRLHLVDAGAGPLVVLLHGFPEFWYTWRHQIPALVGAGFRVIAPDMRGYNLSAKPGGVGAYDIEHLARDVARLVEWAGEERACVVGHDWGAMVAWEVAMRHPDRVTRLGILNVPHPRRMLAGFRTVRQLRRSWYVFFLQLPVVPEALLAATRFAPFRYMMRREPVRPDAFDGEDLRAFEDAWSQPGAMHAAINYYRAAMRRSIGRTLREMRRIDAPTLVVWGEQDPHLGAELAEPERKWVPDVRVVRLPEASHWVQNDAPERVNELLIEFLAPVREEARSAAAG